MCFLLDGGCGRSHTLAIPGGQKMQARVDINYIWLIHLDWKDIKDLCTLAAGSFQEPWGCFADLIHRNSIELVSISGSIVTQKSLTRLFNPACGGNQSISGYLHSRKLFYQCRNGVIRYNLIDFDEFPDTDKVSMYQFPTIPETTRSQATGPLSQPRFEPVFLLV